MILKGAKVSPKVEKLVLGEKKFSFNNSLLPFTGPQYLRRHTECLLYCSFMVEVVGEGVENNEKKEKKRLRSTKLGKYTFKNP